MHKGGGRAATGCRNLSEVCKDMGGVLVSETEVWQKDMMPRKGGISSHTASCPLGLSGLCSDGRRVFKGLGCCSLGGALRRLAAIFPWAECRGFAFSFVNSRVLLELWGLLDYEY